jgi:protein-disulfide isomerase
MQPFVKRATLSILAGLMFALPVTCGLGGCNVASGGSSSADGGQPEGDDLSNQDSSAGAASEQGESDFLAIDLTSDHFKGDTQATNVIIEYGNFLCGHCRDFFAEHLPDLEALVDQGRVLYVYRHLTVSESASTVAQAAECAAAQDEALFFPYHELLYSTSGSISLETLQQYAGDLGLDRAAFDECLAAGETAERVQRDVLSAAELGVSGTPTFLVNGQMLVGVQPIESFEPLLD